MMLIWSMVVLSARCSDVIPLEKAEQSSTRDGLVAANAIDNDLATAISTDVGATWLRVYFSSSTVGKVVVEKAISHAGGCVYTVSVCDGEAETVCGNYTGKPRG